MKSYRQRFFAANDRLARITTLQAKNQWEKGNRISSLFTLVQLSQIPLSAALIAAAPEDIAECAFIGAEVAALYGLGPTDIGGEEWTMMMAEARSRSEDYSRGTPRKMDIFRARS